jgi:hypothetical protein
MDCLRYLFNYGLRYIPQEDDSEDEIEYKGTYTKYPAKKSSGGSYYSLVEGPAGKAGQF